MNTRLIHEGLMQTLAPDGQAAHTQLRLIHEGLMQTLAPDGQAAQLRKRLPLVARRQDGSHE